MQFTTQTKINEVHAEFLDKTAEYIGKLRAKLLKDMLSDKASLSELKKQYLFQYGITARQFNALAAEIKGIIKSARTRKKKRINELKEKVSRLEKQIERMEKKSQRGFCACEIEGSKSGIRRLRFRIHQKKRQLSRTQDKIENLKVQRVSICLGSKELFLSQFNLEENGYQTHEEWALEWKKRRTDRVFYIGSKDESCGNQSCKLVGDELKVRVIPKQETIYGKSYSIPGVVIAYGREAVLEALEEKRAINYRFVRKKDKWYLFLTTERKAAEIVTDNKKGAVAIDVNSDHLAWVDIDKAGNLINYGACLTPTQDCTTERTEAMLSDALGDLVEYARKAGKPIVVEKLDFGLKKKTLSERGTRYARKLSSFAYAKFFSLLTSKCSREGVLVSSQNPAYTSIIGRYKYMQMYGITEHVAASLVLARRFLGYSERIPSKYALYLAEHKYGHVWSTWSKFKRAVSNRELQVNILNSIRKKVSALISLTGDECPLTCNLT